MDTPAGPSQESPTPSGQELNNLKEQFQNELMLLANGIESVAVSIEDLMGGGKDKYENFTHEIASITRRIEALTESVANLPVIRKDVSNCIDELRRLRVELSDTTKALNHFITTQTVASETAKSKNETIHENVSNHSEALSEFSKKMTKFETHVEEYVAWRRDDVKPRFEVVDRIKHSMWLAWTLAALMAALGIGRMVIPDHKKVVTPEPTPMPMKREDVPTYTVEELFKLLQDSFTADAGADGTNDLSTSN